MTTKQFNTLAARLLNHEFTTADPVRQAYWGKHFVRLISLCRNQNLGFK